MPHTTQAAHANWQRNLARRRRAATELEGAGLSDLMRLSMENPDWQRDQDGRTHDSHGRFVSVASVKSVLSSPLDTDNDV